MYSLIIIFIIQINNILIILNIRTMILILYPVQIIKNYKMNQQQTYQGLICDIANMDKS